jgi:UDP-N-acetylglucosamine transferase subunit ALG13
MTTLLVATHGGHLAQLHELAPRLRGIESSVLWVTNDSPQARALLADESVRFVPYIAERDWLGVARSITQARRILREHEVTAVVSTGSALALGYLGAAAAARIPAHYIESATRVTTVSITGRALAKVPGVRTYGQSPHLDQHSWPYVGSVFDVYRSEDPLVVDPPSSQRIRRVLVSLGTSDRFPFRRLVERLLAIMPADTEVTWQVGNTPVEDLGITGHPFLDADRMDEELRAADAVITHAGTGSALAALRAGRCAVLVPRRPDLGEFPDDHQVRLAKDLDQKFLAICRDADDLCWDDVITASQRRIVEDHLGLAPIALR